MKLRRERCVQCDRALTRYEYVTPQGVKVMRFGYGGSGYFCTQFCGHAYAVAMIREVEGWGEDQVTTEETR